MQRLIAAALGWMTVVPFAHAADVALTNPLGADNLKDVIDKVAPTLIAIAAPIATIMVIYGAFLMITSGGNDERISTGRKTILYAAIGFAAVLLASSIVPVILDVFKK
ncbi:MAG: hypothetical protein HYW65_00025 [Candidatus Liptonbacteria bacterium]|nr:hypothetical protein [Candidatus Liptonbacteria bacterium]MBI3114798.1 hypothetical protein [Candidatus Harrisonbacteria bacterium]